MRTFFRVFLLCLLFGVFLPLPASGTASLYIGGKEAGSVATTEGPSSGLWVSAEDVGALLGFSSIRVGEELRLMRGNVQLRLLTNAAAAWRGPSLISLRTAPFERDGRFWMDEASATAFFQRDAGTGPQNRIRFMGKALEPESPSKPVTPAVVPTPAPPQSKPQSPPQRQTQTPAQPKPQPQPAIASTPDPKNGEIRRLRWGNSPQKIRGVVDTTDDAEPRVWTEGGVVHALFASAPENPEGLYCPFENVKVTMTRGEAGVELAFTANGARVQRLLLSSPRRLVLDFHFPSGTKIRAAAPQPKQPVAVTPTTPSLPPASNPAPAPTPVPPVRMSGKKLVVVDPGHGGKDPGTAANNVREKDVNLAIGLELEKELKARGFDVLMTRRTDVYLKLQERTDIANKAKADVFVSVHVNALPSAKKTSGFEIYIMALPTDKDALALAKIENREYVEGKAANAQDVDKRTEMLLKILGDMQQNNKINESTELAENLFAAGKQNGIPMRRVAQAPFFVLRGAGMPAVLLETGFVTNATEAKLLAHPGYRQRIAQAMAAGIVNYLK
ncbi:MAG: N-acetylmuramoyl-L-alanine amidase [Synergistaceae bacterium]|nr:N-acetylmuramoyl-L-alanine amidase [Synergistaceae bacterium]